MKLVVNSKIYKANEKLQEALKQHFIESKVEVETTEDILEYSGIDFETAKAGEESKDGKERKEVEESKEAEQKYGSRIKELYEQSSSIVIEIKDHEEKKKSKFKTVKISDKEKIINPYKKKIIA